MLFSKVWSLVPVWSRHYIDGAIFIEVTVEGTLTIEISR